VRSITYLLNGCGSVCKAVYRFKTICQVFI
jgi:hypothetical protein